MTIFKVYIKTFIFKVFIKLIYFLRFHLHPITVMLLTKKNTVLMLTLFSWTKFWCWKHLKGNTNRLSITFSLFTLSFTLFLFQSQDSPYSMSVQRNVRALWANGKGEGWQNQVCVSQPVWYLQRKEPWSTEASWWVCILVIIKHMI